VTRFPRVVAALVALAVLLATIPASRQLILRASAVCS
jgi:hypothetical protein